MPVIITFLSVDTILHTLNRVLFIHSYGSRTRFLEILHKSRVCVDLALVCLHTSVLTSRATYSCAQRMSGDLKPQPYISEKSKQRWSSTSIMLVNQRLHESAKSVTVSKGQSVRPSCMNFWLIRTVSPER